MRMVASAKLHRTQGMTEKFLRYRDELEHTLSALTGGTLPLTGGDALQGREGTGGSILLIPISSNSGLCGAFNSNITRATLQRLQELEAAGHTVRLLPIGKKISHDLQNRGIDCNIGYFNLLDKIEKTNGIAEVSFLVEYCQQLQQNGEIDQVEFLFHHFKSMGSQVITKTTLPMAAPSSDVRGKEQGARSKEQEAGGYLTEPSPQALYQALYPRLLNAQAYGIMLDTLTSEHAARMLAMQNADDNANEMLQQLQLLYNKTRQQSITNELLDMMGGKVDR